MVITQTGIHVSGAVKEHRRPMVVTLAYFDSYFVISVHTEFP